MKPSGLVFVLLWIAAIVAAQNNEPDWQTLLARADSLETLAQYDSALVLAQQALEITEQAYGMEDTSVAQALNLVGIISWRKGMLNETESALVRALNIREKVLGPNHPSIGRTLGNLAVLYYTQGRYLEAVSLTE